MSWAPYLISVGMGVAAMAADFLGNNVAAGIILLTEAAIMGIWFYQKDKCLVSFRFLLSVFWIGGEGLAVFRLSYLHPDWNWITWVCFTLFYVLFLAGYDIANVKKVNKKEKACASDEVCCQDKNMFEKRLYYSIIIMAIISSAAFIFEAVCLGYIPLFSNFTHAYDHFHMSGVHYFTVSCWFVPALTTIFVLNKEKGKRLKKQNTLIIVICNITAILNPILCISKFQFAITILLCVILFLLTRSNIPLKRVILGFCVLAVLLGTAAVFMTISRHYKPGYLDSIFEMKDASLPIAVQYVYMYIANNYANFNELTAAIAQGQCSFALGMKELFPVFALTGLKFIAPQLVNYPAPVTKTELNTLTIIYDSYYDFGIIGVILFGFVLGFACRKISKNVGNGKNPIGYIFYGQIAMYLMLSFFSAWFTVPTTWFWLAVTGVLYFYTSGANPRDWVRNKRRIEKKGNL